MSTSVNDRNYLIIIECCVRLIWIFCSYDLHLCFHEHVMCMHILILGALVAELIYNGMRLPFASGTVWIFNNMDQGTSWLYFF